MTNKAYIVANEQQEREVLHKFELKGYVWFGEGEKPTEWVPSHIEHLVEFPYALLDDGELSWCYMLQLGDAEVVYDGRKESKVKISKEVYDALEEWRSTVGNWADSDDISKLPENVKDWWTDPNEGIQSDRLIAIIRFSDYVDVFEVEKPKKWIVRSKETDIGGDYRHVLLYDSFDLINSKVVASQEDATKFDTKEEAESWANAHQEVVEVVDV